LRQDGQAEGRSRRPQAEKPRGVGRDDGDAKDGTVDGNHRSLVALDPIY